MTEKILAVDTSTIRNFAALGPEGLDLLFHGTDRIVITDDVYTELVNNLAETAPTRIAFEDWFNRHFDPGNPLASNILRPEYRVPATYNGLSANRGNAGELSLEAVAQLASTELQSEFTPYLGEGNGAEFRLIADDKGAYERFIHNVTTHKSVDPAKLAEFGNYESLAIVLARRHVAGIFEDLSAPEVTAFVEYNTITQVPDYKPRPLPHFNEVMLFANALRDDEGMRRVFEESKDKPGFDDDQDKVYMKFRHKFCKKYGLLSRDQSALNSGMILNRIIHRGQIADFTDEKAIEFLNMHKGSVVANCAFEGVSNV